MKVYVITKAKLLGAEEYVGVKSKFKLAEAELRKKYPHMRKDPGTSATDYLYLSDASKEPTLLFIHEEELE